MITRQLVAKRIMESSSDQKMMSKQPSKQKGGIRTLPFIIANETFEKVASYGLLPNMILYLIMDYHMDSATGAIVLLFWSAASNFTSIVGAFLSDSYLGRFRVIALGSICSLLGTILLWLTAMIPQARPSPCNLSNRSCQSPSSAHLSLLFSSFMLISIGASGTRPCSLAFGADQLDKEDNPKNARVLQSFFNWYYASVAISILISVTVIVYIQDIKGWKVGFGVPAILMFMSVVLFFLGSSFYVKVKANKSLLIGFAQVVVAAMKNRHLAFPPNNSEGWYHHKKDSNLVAPSDKLRFLNKACIIRNPEEEIGPDGSSLQTWKLCTVEQVEDFKSLMKVIPIWSTGIVFAVAINQNLFPVLQAKSMDRHLTSNFQIPAGSFGVFAHLTLIIWVAIYDRILIPLMEKFTGRRRGLGLKLRMGIGLLISCAAMAMSAMVERIRRRTAIRQGFSEYPQAVVNMSAMWLIPQHCLMGLGEAFNSIGQIEFYYFELPKSMSSIVLALLTLGMGVGTLVGSLIVGVVANVTKKEGKDSWVSTNLNKGHYDYYYWVLTVLCFVNFLYFLVCSWAYGDCTEGNLVLSEKEEGTTEAQLSMAKASPKLY